MNLSKHIAALREKEAGLPVAPDAILFWGTAEDKNYLTYLKPCVGSVTTLIRLEKLSTVTTLQMYCKSKHITRVVSTSIELLEKLLHWDKRARPSLSNYVGSYFTVPTLEGDGNIEIVFTAPLKQLVTVSYGKFMATRMISKLTRPGKWYVPTRFSFEVVSPTTIESYFYQFQSAFLISIDIETLQENTVIRCVSYTAFFYDSESPSGLHSTSIVLPLDSEYALVWMKKFNWELKAPKVFQNGKYDIAYFARYNAPVYNYRYDTAHMFHSWYSELPKDLGFLNGFLIREAYYWKDLAETTDLYEYYRYNALDTWGTGNSLLAMLLELPEYALNNYALEFPLVFPCHMSEMRGIARDMDRIAEAKVMAEAIIAEHSTALDTILGVKNFNVNSPKQMKQLLTILGCGDLESADEKNLLKARFRHPFNARIINHVLAVRKARKLVSTYLTPGKEFTRFDGTGHRILYALNPHGTDSSRLASREHHFWCGLQIQNIPRGPVVKRTLRADEGFFIAEADLEQAESRDTAYISGEETLIQAVEYSPDFHSANASAFFGVPFEKIFDVALHKTIDKALRDLAKRVNHGANYNMGPNVLIETMGEENIIRAKQLLGLPRFWGYKAVAEYLLEQFHRTYPGIRKVFYEGVVKEIVTTRKLTSTALHNITSQEEYSRLWNAGARAWVRYCFGNPDSNKSDLNSYISHPPQSLNAQTLNKAYLSVFTKIAIHPDHRDNFKLLAQIHDSILFQYRQGHDYLCDRVKECMEIPVTIKAYDGKIRTFTVPASVKSGKDGKLARYWSETE